MIFLDWVSIKIAQIFYKLKTITQTHSPCFNVISTFILAAFATLLLT